LRQPDDEALTAPQLDILALDQMPRLLDGFRIVGTRQPHEPDKMPVAPDEIYSIVHHPATPTDLTKAIKRLSGTSGNGRALHCRGQKEERTMPVLLLWGIPAVIFVGGVGYFLVHATH
jgi:hypothetical protein